MLKFGFLSVVVVLCSASPVYAQMIFEDNFDNPAVSEANWEFITGHWEFKDGMLYSMSANVRFITTYVVESKWDRDKPNEFDEYTMEFRPGGIQAVEPAGCVTMTWGDIKVK